MSYEDPDAPVTPTPARRSPRQGVGGSPMGSTISIVLAVVAVIVGFLILHNITDDGPSAGDGGSTPVDSAVDSTPSIGRRDLVDHHDRAAARHRGRHRRGRQRQRCARLGRPDDHRTRHGRLHDGRGDSTPRSPGSPPRSSSTTRPSPRRRPSPSRWRASMGGLTVEVVPTPAPVEGGSLNGAGVLVLLGTDQADKTIAQLSAPTASVTPAPIRRPATTDDHAGRHDRDHHRLSHAPRLRRQRWAANQSRWPARRAASARRTPRPLRSRRRATRRRGSAGSSGRCARPIPTIASTGIPYSAASDAMPPTTLPGGAGVVEAPLAGDHEVGAVEVVVEVEFVGDQLEAGQQRAAERGQRTAEPARSAAAGDRRDVDAEVVEEHLRHPLQATGEHRRPVPAMRPSAVRTPPLRR